MSGRPRAESGCAATSLAGVEYHSGAVADRYRADDFACATPALTEGLRNLSRLLHLLRPSRVAGTRASVLNLATSGAISPRESGRGEAMTIRHWMGVLAAICVGLGSAAHAGPTLDKVKQAGQISCGVGTGIAGFMAPDSQGRWTGFDVDICRAISAAVFGAPDKVKYVPLMAQQRFTALQSGEVDLLSNNTTDTLQR